MISFLHYFTSDGNKSFLPWVESLQAPTYALRDR